jgi:hypothetical protein
MHPDDAFDEFQDKVNADASHVRKARHRRDIFGDAFKPLEEVTEIIPSGSLARGTQLDPIHDVDLILVFDKTAHPDWGADGDSAKAALSYAQKRVQELLGDWGSLTRHLVGQTLLRNHVVKCFLDPRFLAEDEGFKGMFAVEVMPALRVGEKTDSVLLLPERKQHRWQPAAPELLISKVQQRQERWEYFVPMIRVIKFWTRHVDADMKSLAAEVLALKCLPDPATGELSRSIALLRFFTAAAVAVMLPITDPAGYCGEIQPDLDRATVSDLLREASDIAAVAVAWENQREYHKAICAWRAIFGPDFPEPPGGCPSLGGRRGGLEGGPGPEPGNGGPGRPGPIADDGGRRPDRGGRDGSVGPDPQGEAGGEGRGPHGDDGGTGGDRAAPFDPDPGRPVEDAPQG